MTESNTYEMLSNEEIRLLRAFDRMTAEQQKELMDYLLHLLRMQEHAPDLPLCSD